MDPDMVTAALAGLDDTTVLFREKPVAVVDLCRRIMAACAGTGCESLTVVHPSWWPAHRVARIVDAAAAVATTVLAQPRWAVITEGDCAIVIEIADDIVAVSSSGGSAVLYARADNPAEVAQCIEIPTATGILIDAPLGVIGAAEYADGLRASLRQRGATAELARVRDVPPPSSAVDAVAAPPPVRPWRGPVFAAAGVALTLCAIGATAVRPTTSPPTEQAGLIVEGRIAVRIPNQWVITRITAGPGSRRLQATAPTDQDVALHVTQSFAPGETLDRSAELLRQAVAEQPQGVFVDFNPADLRGGRPAVSYREMRVGRDIRWTVFLDGSTRISVGCQSAPGKQQAVAQPCEQAIASAHELSGTKPGR